MRQLTVPPNKDEAVQTERKLALEPVMSSEEAEWLGWRAHNTRVVLEIGSLAGGSLSVMNSKAADDALLISVDPYIYRDLGPGWDPKARFRERFATEIESGRIIQVQMKSEVALPIVHSILNGRPVDLLHIDGDHRGPAVAMDLELYPPLVRPGGIICGHDYDQRHVGLREAVDEKYGDRLQLVDALWWVTQ